MRQLSGVPWGKLKKLNMTSRHRSKLTVERAAGSLEACAWSSRSQLWRQMQPRPNRYRAACAGYGKMAPLLYDVLMLLLSRCSTPKVDPVSDLAHGQGTGIAKQGVMQEAKTNAVQVDDNETKQQGRTSAILEDLRAELRAVASCAGEGAVSPFQQAKKPPVSAGGGPASTDTNLSARRASACPACTHPVPRQSRISRVNLSQAPLRRQLTAQPTQLSMGTHAYRAQLPLRISMRQRPRSCE